MKHRDISKHPDTIHALRTVDSKPWLGSLAYALYDGLDDIDETADYLTPGALTLVPPKEVGIALSAAHLLGGFNTNQAKRAAWRRVGATFRNPLPVPIKDLSLVVVSDRRVRHDQMPTLLTLRVQNETIDGERTKIQDGFDEAAGRRLNWSRKYQIGLNVARLTAPAAEAIRSDDEFMAKLYAVLPEEIELGGGDLISPDETESALVS